MKLPENKRDRNLLLAFVAVTVVALAYLAQTIYFAPMKKARAQDRAKQEELEGKIAKAERELRVAPGFTAKLAGAQAELSSLVSNRLLRPILGSFQISLQERLAPLIRSTGFQLAALTPIGNQPLPARDHSGAFACYLAEITGTGSFETICRLIEALLSASPCIHVTEITIQGQGKEKTEMHRASVRFEWAVPATEKE